MKTPAKQKQNGWQSFAISNQSDIEQLKENFKKQKYFESNLDLVESLAGFWATERKVNKKIEEYQREELHKILQALKRLRCIV